jgi:hypothetical protein
MFIDPKNKKKMIGPSQKSTVPAGFYRQITCFAHCFRNNLFFLSNYLLNRKKTGRFRKNPPAEITNALLKGHIINFSKITNYGKH